MNELMNELINAIQNLGKPDWLDYVQFGATIINILISGLAIFVAVTVPNKIAKNQNKISLFEKRYEAFQFFEKCFVFSKALHRSETSEARKKSCLDFLDINSLENPDIHFLNYKISHYEYMLHQMEFLFPELKENDVRSLYEALERVLVDIISNNENKESVNAYITTMADFACDYNKTIWDSLRLQ